MPLCQFYALGSDRDAIVDFVFSQPGWRLLERYSEYDQPLRAFPTRADVVRAFSPSGHAQLCLSCDAMGGRVSHRRITLEPGAVPGATFRYVAEGSGLIQLLFKPVQRNRLSPSSTDHNSERRARRYAVTADELAEVAAWSWAEVTRVSSKLNRFIRRIAVDKTGSRPILPAAAAAVSSGELTLAPH